MVDSDDILNSSAMYSLPTFIAVVKFPSLNIILLLLIVEVPKNSFGLVVELKVFI